jgi:aminopeptidase N
MIWSWMSGLIADDHAAAPNQPAMVSKEYETPGEVFDRKANPYGKGAIVLHMLRARLGDDIFFRGLAEYLNTHAGSSVETVQFRQSMERASAQSLQRFFDQWCYRPGHPDLTVSSTFESGTLKVAFEQHQPIDGYNPAFDLRIPIWALTKSNNLDTWTKLEARFDTRTFTLEAPLPAAPSMVLIDPELTTLADITLSTDTADLAAQLRSGPTPGSRLRAAAALGKAADSPEIAATALASVLHSDPAHRELRIACAKSLAELASPGWIDNKHRSAERAKTQSVGIAAATDALRRALEAKFSDSRIRAAVLEQSAHALALADSGPRADLASRCSRIFAADRSYAVRAAAIRAIGTLGVAAEMPTVLKALETNSHREQIRQAAISALTDLDTPEAYAEVIKRTGPANPSFVRSAATAALGDLAHHDNNRTILLLATLLDDREPRTANAAGNALADIGGPKARAIFESRAEASPSRSIRGQMKVWLQRFPPVNKPPETNAQTE